jgi:diphosphomevalonate decarboxylase
MPDGKATAVACANIAFIKYWGNRDDRLRLPANGSLSMNLSDCTTRTMVQFDRDLLQDSVRIQNEPAAPAAAARVSAHLDLLRERAGLTWRARVESENNFPMGAGIASSASAFASLTVAAAFALQLPLGERDLSILARRGSGSASRSIPAGFVEWYASDRDDDSFAESIAAPEHWELFDLVAIVNDRHKKISSEEGNRLAATSPFQRLRVEDAGRRLSICRQAIQDRDFEALAAVMEEDTRLMHAVMLTSRPPLLYGEEGTVSLIREIAAWRKAGLAVAYTVDAGPNVHCICLPESADEVRRRLGQMPSVQQILGSRPGPGVKIVG